MLDGEGAEGDSGVGVASQRVSADEIRKPQRLGAGVVGAEVVHGVVQYWRRPVRRWGTSRLAVASSWLSDTLEGSESGRDCMARGWPLVG